MDKRKQKKKSIAKTQTLTNMSLNKEQSLIAHIPLYSDDDSNDDNSDIEDEKPSCNSYIDFDSDIVQDLEQENTMLRSRVEVLGKKLVALNQETLNNTRRLDVTRLSISHMDNLENPNNIKCWWCCHDFDNIPIYLPQSKTGMTFHVWGNFCSFNCACAYNHDMKDSHVWTRHHLLNQMCNLCTCDDQKTKITPSPPKEMLNDFGGNMDIVEFRHESIILEKTNIIFLPPIKPIGSHVESQLGDYDKTYGGSKYVPLDKKMVAKASHNLKLKRTKQLKKKHSNIEDAMGLVRKNSSLFK
uniref:MYM-type domain-containing protein n=1 Tax=Megaviridae environmental sample TaxID=1737588 RepID=A0A5J6VIH0_9VIRU|nr:MAG: hypothetical protein [Megaviridae environmental sample]